MHSDSNVRATGDRTLLNSTSRGRKSRDTSLRKARTGRYPQKTFSSEVKVYKKGEVCDLIGVLVLKKNKFKIQKKYYVP